MSMRRTAAAPSGSPLLAATKSTLDGRYGPSDRLCSAHMRARSCGSQPRLRWVAAATYPSRCPSLPAHAPKLAAHSHGSNGLLAAAATYLSRWPSLPALELGSARDQRPLARPQEARSVG